MIVHVLNRAKESKVGEVLVASPDKEIVETVQQNGGKGILTTGNHDSGSDRIYEVYNCNLKHKVDFIINLQGDMPNVKPECIAKLIKLMQDNECDIGTLASKIKDTKDINDENIVKVQLENDLKKDSFLKAVDFFRTKNDLKDEKIYHHLGIYAFTNVALTKYVSHSRSKLEKERKLEQMRAMENNLTIKVGLSDSLPLSVDTELDLKKVTEEMSKL